MAKQGTHTLSVHESSLQMSENTRVDVGFEGAESVTLPWVPIRIKRSILMLMLSINVQTFGTTELYPPSSTQGNIHSLALSSIMRAQP